MKTQIFERFRRKKKPESRIVSLSVDAIRPGKSQPRTRFEKEPIERLAESIRQYGILEPLSVRRISNKPPLYECVGGERRLRAAKSIGLPAVPCRIINADDRLTAEISIVDNLLREDLGIFETAAAFERLSREFGLSQDAIAEKMGLSQSAVANKIRLMKLSEAERDKLSKANLSERHARALLRIKAPEVRAKVLDTIIKEKKNVAETESYISELLKEKGKPERIEPISCESSINHNVPAPAEKPARMAEPKQVDLPANSGKSSVILRKETVTKNFTSYIQKLCEFSSLVEFDTKTDGNDEIFLVRIKG